MDKVSQLREMRERNAKAGRVRSLVNPRTLPSAEAIKAAADRAETKSAEKRMLAAGGAYRPAQHVATHVFTGPESLPAVAAVTPAVPISSTQRKTTKMSETEAASDFDKSGYMRLYQRVKRAKTDADRETAEAALRVAFPNKRPRGAKSEPLIPRTAVPPHRPASKPLRSVKALKRAVNGKKSRKAQRSKKKKGRR